ncbi:alpha/beta fold hydrolase [Actinokineospora fastidiosa]|uniref:3-oxoadipate enol-lactonase n=1 Tax=Actinokineospora fastidiosa TaxID=1816 RepID=A0A918GI51_9PSEU|nr:alpha/beta hydrolase [Actinokineospora fastidiosa]GGS39102.1 3-oxoadipate enol-lactonase [Actinokineospora fastidiosa]
MWTDRRARVSDGVELFVADKPGHSPLLVIHGGPDWDHTYLRTPLHDLDRRVLLPDLRGCGRSTRGLPSYTWDEAVTDLLALLDALEVPRADVLGFSTGGLIAQRLTLTAPHRVRRLVVASSSVIPLPPDAFAGWTERDRRLAEGADALPPDLTGAEANRARAIAFATCNVWRAESLPDYLDRLSRIAFSGDWSRAWEAGALPPVRVPDAEARLIALGVPILLLHGRQDMTFPAALAEQAAARNPSATAVILDEAGHMAHIDQPGAWLGALSRFLA